MGGKILGCIIQLASSSLNRENEEEDGNKLEKPSEEEEIKDEDEANLEDNPEAEKGEYLARLSLPKLVEYYEYFGTIRALYV